MKNIMFLVLLMLISCRKETQPTFTYTTPVYTKCSYNYVDVRWTYPDYTSGFSIDDELGFRVWLSVNNTNYKVVENISPSMDMHLQASLFLNNCDQNWIMITAYSFYYEKKVYTLCWGKKCPVNYL